MPKGIVILGSTGSIGRQTLEVISLFPDDFRVIGLAAGSNVSLLADQIKKFSPQVAAIKDKTKAEELRNLTEGEETEIVVGETGFCHLVARPDVELVVNAVTGFAGLLPTIEAIKHKKDIALANKETLVAAGHIVMAEAHRTGSAILPVDSEHSAIFQCLQGQNKALQRIILTASGGPFRDFPREELTRVTPEMALKHPNWQMGKKITIDSATLMNKGLEVIEAKWLFNLDFKNIDVLVHPQSIIHSLVEFADTSQLAQLGLPDMRLPIQYALFYPERVTAPWPRLDLAEIEGLTFTKPDTDRFPSLKIAYQAGQAGGSYPVVLNAANEVAVQLFLEKKIAFTDIPKLIEDILEKHQPVTKPDLMEILEIDFAARALAREWDRISI